MSNAAARLALHPAFTIASIEPNLFGSFVEHLGRGVYGGIFDPTHPTATEAGFRSDVGELVRELGVTTVRYPGGNFVSAYDWRDGIGPVEERPSRLDPAWHSIEPNLFGINEFAAWCSYVNVEPMMALNFGTAGVKSALELFEYSNFPGGTALSDLRKQHGFEKPHDIKMWCLGNEMDGPWQVGSMTAVEYGRLAAQTGRALRQLDPNIELIACGSSNNRMETFGTWEREVLFEAFDVIDYISCHQYFRNSGDLAEFMGSGVAMDQFIESISATIEHVRAVKRSNRKISISFDEWNVWDWVKHDEDYAKGLDWEVAPPLLEDVYTLADAVVVGDMLISLLNHADVVKAASMAQLVNVIGPIMTEPNGKAWRQTSFYPFADVAQTGNRTAVRIAVESPLFDSAENGLVPSLSAAAAWDQESGEIDIFVVNRNPSEPVELELSLLGFNTVEVTGAQILSHADPLAHNSAQNEFEVAPQALSVTCEENRIGATLPPVSWSTIRVTASPLT